jgi:hypothetical protein
MKKVIVISIMSLIFLATYAQRPSKSRSTEVNDADRKKSEMTTERSDNNTSRSVEIKSDRSGNVNNDRTYTPRSSEDRSDNVNNNRTIITPRNTEDRPDNVYNNRTITTIDDDPSENINRNNNERERNNSNNSNVNSNRSITDKIINNKTDLHKNVEPGRSQSVDSRIDYTANNGRSNSINSRTYEVERKNYNTPQRDRIHREVYDVNRPRPVEYRKIYHPYREPDNIHVFWTHNMYHEYMMIYPDYHYWYYTSGYRIRTTSAYDAIYYVGEVMNVYGRVIETWYSRETDEYFLYFGARYPYQDFSVIIPGHKARQFSRRPEIFFEGRYIWATGLISLNQGQPEMIVLKKHQIHLY